MMTGDFIISGFGMIEAHQRMPGKGVCRPPAAALRQSGWTLDLPVEGHSMEPLLRAGDTVTVCCEATDAWHPGEVVCFQRGPDAMVHRLIEQDAAGKWFEKGDAESGGSWIDSHDIMGRVTHCNGVPFKDPHRRRCVQIGRWERRLSSRLRRVGWRPARWSAVWRRFKMRHLDHPAGE